MKKVLKWIGIIILIFIIFIGCAVGYIKFFLPDVGPSPDLKIELTQERIERGRYLANSVTVCMDCHSKRDWSQYSGPLAEGTFGGGGEIFDRKLGFPGVYYSKNITPYGLGKWSDGDIYRAITSGVSKNNDPLFPVMPYHYYGKLDKEDVYSLIAYVRTLPTVKNDIPEREVDFPLNIILHTIPTKPNHQPIPERSDSVLYGAYLVNAAGCVECHTKVDDKAKIITGMEFGGGREFDLPMGIIRTANITPDETTGLGYWSREKFIHSFKQYQDSNYHSPKLSETDFNTIMPWIMYSQMTESDLSSIYQYLRTLKPLKNEVTKFTPRSVVAVK